VTEPTGLIAVVDGVWRWSVWNEPRKLWFNGHLLRVGDTAVLVDPVPMTDEVAAGLGTPGIIVVTNRDHARSAAVARDRFGARLLVSRRDAAAAGLPADDTIDDGDVVAGELRVVRVADAKTEGELALYWPARRLLVLGDAAVGRPPGALAMLPADKLPDVARARAGVARLADLAPEVILVGDGADILAGGTAALAALGAGPAKAPVGAGAPGC
jgi:glyoxylase-like metal-dependent hydrolase (beta-lactamase superfamily II)